MMGCLFLDMKFKCSPKVYLQPSLVSCARALQNAGTLSLSPEKGHCYYRHAFVLTNFPPLQGTSRWFYLCGIPSSHVWDSLYFEQNFATKKRYLIVHPLAGYPELLNGSNTIFPKQIKLHLQCSADYMKSAFGWVQPYRPMYLIFFDTKITVHEVALIYSS